jgi:MYXO-CTERM domain-containing protein
MGITRTTTLGWLIALATTGAAPAAFAGGASSAATALAPVATAGRTWLWSGADSGARPTRPADPRARALLAKVLPKSASLELAARDEVAFPGGDRVLRYAQTFRGLPVLGAGAGVMLGERTGQVMITANLATRLPESSIPRLTADSAARIAGSRLTLPVTGADAHLAVLRREDAGLLVWAVVPQVPNGLPMAPRVLVDATTGAIVEMKDAVVFGKATVFPTNPSNTPTRVSSDLPIPPTGAVLENPFVSTYNCVDRKRVANVSGLGIPLKIHVCDLEQRATANTEGDYDYAPIDDPQNVESRSDAYSEVSMYFHVTRAYKFFRDLIAPGDTTAQVVADAPLRTISNLQLAKGLMQGDMRSASDPEVPLDPFQNAFFAPAAGGLGDVFQEIYGFNGGAMWFGQGPRHDYSYDGDVVAHEFVHGVVDHSLKLGTWHVDQYGAIAAPGAANEALADYFSSVINGDPNVGEYAVKDIIPNAPFMRTLDNEDSCPGSLIGQVHFDSTVFSGGLWKARVALPEAERPTFDTAIYKAMRAYSGPGELGFDDLVNLFLVQLKADLPQGAKALEKEMTGRGILPTTKRVIDGKGTVEASKGAFSTGVFAAPGGQTLGREGKVFPGIVQFKVDLPKGAKALHVTVAEKENPGGGMANPFGGGTPFAPVLLAKFDGEVTWDVVKLTPRADLALEKQKTGKGEEFLVEIPSETSPTSVYVQVANKGESDGAYKSVSFVLDVVEPVPVPDPAQPDDNGITPPTSQANPVGPSGVDGCGCRVASSSNAAWPALAMGSVALVAIRRRRRRP